MGPKIKFSLIQIIIFKLYQQDKTSKIYNVSKTKKNTFTYLTKLKKYVFSFSTVDFN